MSRAGHRAVPSWAEQSAPFVVPRIITGPHVASTLADIVHAAAQARSEA
jgi:hypothetical protein